MVVAFEQNSIFDYILFKASRTALAVTETARFAIRTVSSTGFQSSRLAGGRLPRQLAQGRCIDASSVYRSTFVLSPPMRSTAHSTRSLNVASRHCPRVGPVPSAGRRIRRVLYRLRGAINRRRRRFLARMAGRVDDRSDNLRETWPSCFAQCRRYAAVAAHNCGIGHVRGR
jgi:hypothetical protein